VHSSDDVRLCVKHCANKAVQFRSHCLYSVLLGCQERKFRHAQNHRGKGQGGSDLEITEVMKWSTPKADPSLRSVLDAEISQWMSGGTVMLKISFGLSSSRSAGGGGH